MVSAAGALDSVGGKGQEAMDMDSSKPTKKIPRNKFVIACAVLASTNSILFGYDVGVMSGAVIFIKKDLKINDVQEEVLIGSLNIISLLGSALAGRTSDAIGRRWTMALAAFIFLVGALVMAVSPSFAWLMVGRSVAGIGVGYALLIAPVYTAEVAPAASRGSLTCFPEIFINVGILIGYIANYALQGLPPHLNWRVMIGLGAVPPLFLGIAVLMMPESPRWLLMRGRNEDAMKVLLRTSVDQAEASERLEKIVEGIQYAKQNALVHESSNPNKTSNPNKSSKNDGEGKWRELYKPSKAIKRMMIIALGIQFFQQAGGIDATVYYSPVTFKTAGINSQGGILGATMAVGFAKAGFVVVAAVLIDKVGRRPLLLTSAIGSTVSLLALATALAVIGKSATVGMGREAASYLAIIAACGNVAFFSVGMGPVNWVLGAEIFPLRLRAKAASLGVAVNRGMSGVVSMTFLSISKAMTVPRRFYLFLAVSALCSTFIYFCVAETKGKTLEKNSESFLGRPQEELEPGNTMDIPVKAETVGAVTIIRGAVNFTGGAVNVTVDNVTVTGGGVNTTGGATNVTVEKVTGEGAGVAVTSGRANVTGGKVTVNVTGGEVTVTGGSVTVTEGAVNATGGAVNATGGAAGGDATGGAVAGWLVTGGVLTGGAVTGGAVTGGAVKAVVLTTAAVKGGAVTGGEVIGTVVIGGVLTGGAVTGGAVTGGAVDATRGAVNVTGWAVTGGDQ